MGTATYRELRVWQLCRDLRDRVLAISAIPAVARDCIFCNQLRSAAASPCANIAEGFGRFRPRDFARFLRIARGSLEELVEHLDRGLVLGVIVDHEHAELVGIAGHAGRALTELILYLDGGDGTGPTRSAGEASGGR